MVKTEEGAKTINCPSSVYNNTNPKCYWLGSASSTLQDFAISELRDFMIALFRTLLKHLSCTHSFMNVRISFDVLEYTTLPATPSKSGPGRVKFTIGDQFVQHQRRIVDVKRPESVLETKGLHLLSPVIVHGLFHLFLRHQLPSVSLTRLMLNLALQEALGDIHVFIVLAKMLKLFANGWRT